MKKIWKQGYITNVPHQPSHFKAGSLPLIRMRLTPVAEKEREPTGAADMDGLLGCCWVIVFL